MSFFDNVFEETQSQLENLCEKRQSYEQEKQDLLSQISKSSFATDDEQKTLTNLAQKQQEIAKQIEKCSYQLDVLRRIFIVSEQVKDLEIDCGVDPILHNALVSAIAPTTFDELSKENLANKMPRYQQVQAEIVQQYGQEYSLYQGQKIGHKSLIYYATTFVAFGRPFYLKVCQRYHVDCGGSNETMQFINAAWDIAQDYLEKQSIAKIA
ncbi:MAG: hypothetical protein AB4206_08875 [Xenococcaceae cyanobacterium]